MKFKFKLPDLGEGITEADVVEWLVKPGQRVKKDQEIAKIETAKALIALPSPVSGKIVEIHYKDGTNIKVGSVLTTIETKDKIKEESKEEFGVVGRIPSAESTNIFETIKEKELKETSSKIKTVKKFDFYGYVDRIPLKGIRKSTKEHLEHTKDYLLVTQTEEADITELSQIRNEKKQTNTEVKLTFLPYIISACIEALKEFPLINSSIEESEIIIKKYYNIGIAVALEGNDGGLIVPVIKGADQKSLFQLAAEIQDLSSKAKQRTIDLQELKGGTFTITNYGSVGSIFATPLPNYPESAILGIGSIQNKLILENNKPTEIETLPLSLTFDHRIIDGAVAAGFLNKLKELLSNEDWIDKLKY